MSKAAIIGSFILGSVITGSAVYALVDTGNTAGLEAQKKQYEQEKLQYDLKISNLQGELADLRKKSKSLEIASADDPKLTPKGEFLGNIVDAATLKEGGEIDFDTIQWLTATEGTCSNDSAEMVLPQCTANGFAIQNANEAPETLKVADDVTIVVQTYGGGECTMKENESIDLKTFASFWGDKPVCEHLQKLPYDIVIEDGVVKSIKERYLP